MAMDIMEIKQVSQLPETASSELHNITQNIVDAVNDIKNSALKIGYNLARVRDDKLYEGVYDSEIEYSEKVFGFKRAQTYNFMRLADVYLDSNGEIAFPDAARFSTTQLIRMSSLPKDELSELINKGEINPDMTVKSIDTKVKEIKESKKSTKQKYNTEKRKKDKEKAQLEKHETKTILNVQIFEKDNGDISVATDDGIITHFNYQDKDVDKLAAIIQKLNQAFTTMKQEHDKYAERIKALKEMKPEEISEYIATL